MAAEPNGDYEEIFLLRAKMSDEVRELVLLYRQPNASKESTSELNSFIKNSAEDNQKLTFFGDFTHAQPLGPPLVLCMTVPAKKFFFLKHSKMQFAMNTFVILLDAPLS